MSIQILGGPERQGTTLDLSIEGLSLSTDRPIGPGSRCVLTLRPTPEQPPLALEVKAVYSSYCAPGDFRIGVVFLPQAAEARERLRALAAANC